MPRVRALLLAGLAVASACAQVGTAPIVIDYPANGSVFPPDMAAPTFLWRDPASGSVSWRIDVSFAAGSPALHVTSTGERMQIGEIDPRCVSPNTRPPSLTPQQAAAHTWKPDSATWAAIKKQSVAGAATIAISGFAAGNASQPVSRGHMLLHTSTDPVGAPIFYRDVPLMPSKSETGVIKPLDSDAVPLIGWRLRDVSQTQSRLLLTDMHTCANCHSFSGDGETLGMDLDGPANDKSLYALAPVRQITTIRNEDVISWASFREELGAQLRLRLMSRFSPDGRRVVTTIKPPGTDGGQLYYVSNFTDYRFLQVFYPTRGILVWYDREARTLKPLPGADDPRYVQANAVWSPDGKYLAFVRAEAKDPSPTGAKMATYANDPAEVQIQYDLYRIPFNDGKGGQPEPIAGASRNGMSNSFPKISPDGRWIVFVQARNGLLMRPDSQLYIVPAAGGQARRMTCNTPLMNSWHSWSPNGRWLVFSSKSRSPSTQMFLTHIDEDGNDSPAILIENTTAANRAANIPEFVNIPPDGIEKINAPVTEYYRIIDDASELMLKRQYAAALPELYRAQALNPSEAAVHNNLGIALFETGKAGEAVTEYEKAIALSPDFSESYNNLGNALAGSGRMDEAVARYQRALELDPEYSTAHGNLGVALARMGKPDEAIPHLQRALAAKPDDAEIHTNLGLSLAMVGQFEEGVAHLEKALAAQPNFEVEFNLGRVLAAKGRFPEAIPHFEQAVKRSGGQDVAALDFLGAAYAEVGRLKEALATAQRALGIATEKRDDSSIQTLKTRIAFYQSRMAGSK